MAAPTLTSTPTRGTVLQDRRSGSRYLFDRRHPQGGYLVRCMALRGMPWARVRERDVTIPR